MRYLALFLALSLAWLWPVPARLTSRVAGDQGDPILNTWILWWNAQALPFTERWWSPPIFYPLPDTLALSEHLFGIAVFTTPLQLAGLNAIGAYNVALILSCWLSGFCAFLLGRRLTGSALAGAIAGVAFAFAPYRAGQLSHLQVLTAQWMPVALLAMHAYLDERRARWLALFGVAWLLQALSNGYFMLFFPVLIGAWLLWFVRWKSDPRPGLVLAGSFVLCSVLLLPSLLKYRAVHADLGLGRQWGEMMLFSADPGAFLRMTYILTFWPAVTTKTQEDLLFPGITAVALVIIAALAFTRWNALRQAVSNRSPLLFYTLATMLMWWLALGPAPEAQPLQAITRPYTGLALLPGFNGLRAPARFAMLGALTLSIAGALAFRRLTVPRPRWRVATAVVVFAGLFVDGWVDAIPLAAPIGRYPLPPAHDATVLELPFEDPVVGATAMFRMIQHGRPTVNGYSGHTPPHHGIMSTALHRGDPSAILHFAEARPLIVVVNARFDEDRWFEGFVGSLPGVQSHGATAAGHVFLLPAQPRRRAGPAGPVLRPVQITYAEREYVVLDLGAPKIVRTLSVPLRTHFGRLHPRMEVETSLDGATWTQAWLDWTGGAAISGALENPRDVPFRIQLPDVEARYLRVHPAPGWLVRDLSIHAAR
ncbi:MAG: hypothetical protein M3478_01425 [Planctomycetota bacterium]|nr:hypothetical protein [Planctomycetota bacterium]